MVRLQMQFPYVKGSELYDGTKHDVDAVDCVQYGSTNIYVVEYIDHKLNKRSRALFNRGKKNISHIPLMNKTGLNDLFNLWKTNKQKLTVDQLFANDKDIGVTDTYQNLDSFMEYLKARLGIKEGISLSEASKALKEGREEIKKSSPPKKTYVDTSEGGSLMDEMVAKAADNTIEPEPETSYYRGRLITYDGKGPFGLPSSSYWYERGNAPYGTRGGSIGGPPMGGPPMPPPPPMGGPEGGPPPEGGPGRHK